jgi:hypothetical protein
MDAAQDGSQRRACARMISGKPSAIMLELSGTGMPESALLASSRCETLV